MRKPPDFAPAATGFRGRRLPERMGELERVTKALLSHRGWCNPPPEPGLADPWAYANRFLGVGPASGYSTESTRPGKALIARAG